jgi:hypothetical protein
MVRRNPNLPSCVTKRLAAHQLPWLERGGRRLLCVQQPPPYKGPWDAAHEPRPVANAGVKVGEIATGDLEVKLARSVWCRAGKLQPITVSVSEPAGSGSIHLGQLGEEGCKQPPMWEFPGGHTPAI